MTETARHFRTRCAVGAFALALAGLPATAIAGPAISRADDPPPCAPGRVQQPRSSNPSIPSKRLDNPFKQSTNPV